MHDTRKHLAHTIKEGTKQFLTGTSSIMFPKLRDNICIYPMCNTNHGNLSIKGFMHLRMRYIKVLAFVNSE